MSKYNYAENAREISGFGGAISFTPEQRERVVELLTLRKFPADMTIEEAKRDYPKYWRTRYERAEQWLNNQNI